MNGPLKSAYAIVLAGGQGARMTREIPKQFLTLGERPVLAWSLEVFERMDEIEGIIIVSFASLAPRAESIAREYCITKLAGVIPGGETRQGSSYNALRCREYHDEDIIVFHDAARPFVSEKIIRSTIAAAAEHGAAGVYVKATDTIAEAKDGFVSRIPDRNSLYNTQTPQAFHYHIIRHAHERALARGIKNSSDDVQMAVDAGFQVKMVDGDYRNIKITTPSDYEAAKVIAASAHE